MGKQNLQLKRSIDRRPISSNRGYNSNPLFFFCSKVFSWIISLSFLEYLIIKLRTKRINLNWLFTLSYLNSHFAIAWVFFTQVWTTRHRCQKGVSQNSLLLVSQSLVQLQRPITPSHISAATSPITQQEKQVYKTTKKERRMTTVLT